MLETVSAIIFTILTGFLIIFQGCLASGVPWGDASFGGKYPGKYPPRMRIIAIINMLILCFISFIVLSRADLLLLQLKAFSRIGIWFVIAFLSVGAVLNTITPSKIERIWAPVSLLQLISSIIVGLS